MEIHLNTVANVKGNVVVNRRCCLPVLMMMVIMEPTATIPSWSCPLPLKQDKKREKNNRKQQLRQYSRPFNAQSQRSNKLNLDFTVLCSIGVADCQSYSYAVRQTNAPKRPLCLPLPASACRHTTAKQRRKKRRGEPNRTVSSMHSRNMLSI